MARARITGAIFLLCVSLLCAASGPVVRVVAPRIAPEAEVLDESGRFRAFSEFTVGRVTLLGLTTSSCAEGDACARLNASFRHVRSLLRVDRSLQRRVRFVSLSLDPVRDVPDRLAEYAARTRGTTRGADWHFVTTLSTRRLAPILAGFAGESAARDTPGNRVFLLDTRGVVRHVYAAEALHALDVLADVRSLADEERRQKSPSDDIHRSALAGQ